jgi:NTE family protein
MAKRALVLGGGGPVGIGWESGIIAALVEAGARVDEADFIVGTSAGSVVGSQLARGRTAKDLYESQLTLAERRAEAIREPIDLAPLIAQFTKLYTSDAPVEQLRAEIGAFALQQHPDEDDWVAGFTASELAGDGAWPARDYACTAIDVADGRFVVWDRASNVPLGLAVASSCAVPGLVPPVTINGKRYMDGGIGSTTNATVANGYDKVLVVQVTRPPGAASGPMAPMIERMRKRFDDELDAVRASGSAVEVIAPDDDFARTFGANLMDFSKRREAAEAGYAQGTREAARIAAFWGA